MLSFFKFGMYNIYFKNQEEDFAKARKELNELREEESKLEQQVIDIYVFSNLSINFYFGDEIPVKIIKTQIKLSYFSLLNLAEYFFNRYRMESPN